MITSGSTVSHTISGLTNGTQYTLRVIATRTGIDDGTPSAEATGTPTATPDATVALTVASATVSEGAGTLTYTVTVTSGVDAAPDDAVSVPVRTVDGSASSAGNQDFTAVDASLSFAVADFTRTETTTDSGIYRYVASKTATVTIADDSSAEGDEEFDIELGTLPAGYAAEAGSGSVTITITDDDPAAQVHERGGDGGRYGTEAGLGRGGFRRRQQGAVEVGQPDVRHRGERRPRGGDHLRHDNRPHRLRPDQRHGIHPAGDSDEGGSGGAGWRRWR